MTYVAPAAMAVTLESNPLRFLNEQVKAALKKVGFELLDCDDLAVHSECDWFEKFAPSCSLSGFKTTKAGIRLTNMAVNVMEVSGGSVMSRVVS
jgi:hypothetical protein